MKQRALLLTVLFYVALDLAWPGLPGAFVFDPAGSVDSIERTRSRATVEVAVVPPLAVIPCPLPPRCSEHSERVVSPTLVSPAARAVVSRLPRATLDPAPPREDPH